MPIKVSVPEPRPRHSQCHRRPRLLLPPIRPSPGWPKRNPRRWRRKRCRCRRRRRRRRHFRRKSPRPVSVLVGQDQVVPGAALERVGSIAAPEGVVAGATLQEVVAPCRRRSRRRRRRRSHSRIQRTDPVRFHRHWGNRHSRPCRQKINVDPILGAAVNQRVHAVAAYVDVVAFSGTADNLIVASAGVHRIIAAVGRDHVVALAGDMVLAPSPPTTVRLSSASGTIRSPLPIWIEPSSTNGGSF